MAVVTQQYVDSLPPIYRDILAAFPEIAPARKVGEGLTFQTLFARLREAARPRTQRDTRRTAWSYREIVEACRNMERAGAVKIEQTMFVCPTEVGEQIIAALTGKQAAEHHVDEFPPIPQG
jgi:hypothetical protein